MNTEECIEQYRLLSEWISEEIINLRDSGDISQAEEYESFLKSITHFIDDPINYPAPQIRNEIWIESGIDAPVIEKKSENNAITNQEFTGNPKIDEWIFKLNQYETEIIAKNRVDKFSEIIGFCLSVIPEISDEKISQRFIEIQQNVTAIRDQEINNLVDEAFRDKNPDKIAAAIDLKPDSEKVEELNKKYQELLSEIQPGGDTALEINNLLVNLGDDSMEPRTLESTVRRAEYFINNDLSKCSEEFVKLTRLRRQELKAIYVKDGRMLSAAIAGDLKQRFDTYQEAIRQEDLKRNSFLDRNGAWVDRDKWINDLSTAWINISSFTTRDTINKANLYLPYDPIAFTDHINGFLKKYGNYVYSNDMDVLTKALASEKDNCERQLYAKSLIIDATKEVHPYGKYEKRVKGKLAWPGLLKIKAFEKLQSEINNLRPIALKRLIDDRKNMCKDVDNKVSNIFVLQEINEIHKILDTAINDLEGIRLSCSEWEEDREQSDASFELPEEILLFQNDIENQKQQYQKEKSISNQIWDTCKTIQELINLLTPQNIQEAQRLSNNLEENLGIEIVRKYYIYRKISDQIISHSTFAVAVERIESLFDHSDGIRDWLSIKGQIEELQARNDYMGSATESQKYAFRLVNFRIQIRLTIDELKRKVERFEWEYIRERIEDLEQKSSSFHDSFPEFNSLDIAKFKEKISECLSDEAKKLEHYYSSILNHFSITRNMGDTDFKRSLSARPIDKLCSLYTDLGFISGLSSHTPSAAESITFSCTFVQAEALHYQNLTKQLLKEKVVKKCISLCEKKSDTYEFQIEEFERISKYCNDLNLLKSVGLIELDVEVKALEWFEISLAFFHQQHDLRGKWEDIQKIWDSLRADYPANSMIKKNQKIAIIENCKLKADQLRDYSEKESLILITLKNIEAGDEIPLIYYLAHFYWDSKNYSKATEWLKKIDPDQKMMNIDLKLELAELEAEAGAEALLQIGDFGSMILELKKKTKNEPLLRSTYIKKYLDDFIKEKQTSLIQIIEQNRNGTVKQKTIAYEGIVDLGILEKSTGISEKDGKTAGYLSSMIDVLPETAGLIMNSIVMFFQSFASRPINSCIEEIMKYIDRLKVIDDLICANLTPDRNSSLVDIVNSILLAHKKPPINNANPITYGQVLENLSIAQEFLSEIETTKHLLEESDKKDPLGRNELVVIGLSEVGDRSFNALSEIERNLDQCARTNAHQDVLSFKEKLDGYKALKNWVENQDHEISQHFLAENFKVAEDLLNNIDMFQPFGNITLSEYSEAVSLLGEKKIFLDLFIKESSITGRKSLQECIHERMSQISDINDYINGSKFLNDYIETNGYHFTHNNEREFASAIKERQDVVNRLEKQELMQEFKEGCSEILRACEFFDEVTKVTEIKKIPGSVFDPIHCSYSSICKEISSKLSLIIKYDFSTPSDIKSRTAQSMVGTLDQTLNEINKKQENLIKNQKNILALIKDDWPTHDRLLKLINGGNLVAINKEIKKFILYGVELYDQDECNKIADRINDYLKKAQNPVRVGFFDRILGNGQ